MKMAAFRTTSFKDPQTHSFQGEVSGVLNSLQKNPFLAGTLITEMKDTDPNSPTYEKMIPIKLGTNNVQLPHGLPQEPDGFLVIFQDAPASVFQVIPPPPQDEQERKNQKRDALSFITLNASDEVTVKVWVF